MGISSDLQQYNQAASERAEEFRPEERDENGRLIDPLQEAIWELSYYNSERELRELCKDCSALTPINPTITEEMVNGSLEELEAAQKLAILGKPVNSSNIQKVKNGQIDDIDPVADLARGNPSETNRPKPTQPTDTEWNNFDKNGEDDLSLLDEKGKQHILEGDSPKSGGHRFGTGNPGKTEFPENWSDQKIENTLSDIVTDPNTVWGKPNRLGYVRTDVHREGLDIRVIYDRNNNRIVTGFPTNTPMNPK